MGESGGVAPSGGPGAEPQAYTGKNFILGGITNFEFRFAPDIRITQLGRILNCL